MEFLCLWGIRISNAVARASHAYMLPMLLLLVVANVAAVAAVSAASNLRQISIAEIADKVLSGLSY